MQDEERLTDTIPAFRVNDETSKVVRGIVKTDRRTISDVARALLERGVAAYQRDGKLFEPEEVQAEAAPRPDTIVPRQVHTIGKEGIDSKKKTG